MRLDDVFHKTLASCAQAPDVFVCLEGLNLPMNRTRHISAREFSPTKLVSQHAAIVEAINNSDPNSAEQAMRTHLREIIKDLPQVIATYPDYFEHVEALEEI